MRQLKALLFSGACALALLVQAVGTAAAADNFKWTGDAFFTNVSAGTQQGEVVPYIGLGFSDLIGLDFQSGSILNTSGLMPVDATTFTFYGEVGPHPFLQGHPSIHVISTVDGDIYCTWTAVFTLKIINSNGDAVLSGDGDFTVTGGTGAYHNATGTFRTLFVTDKVRAGSDDASALVHETGSIHKR